jgi:hypothetical protein
MKAYHNEVKECSSFEEEVEEDEVDTIPIRRIKKTTKIKR